MYHRKPWRIAEDVGIVRAMLDEAGFTETESHLNEWNYNRKWEEPDHYSSRVRPTAKGAAFVAAVMCECQGLPVDMLMYYDLRPNICWCGPFAPHVYDIRPPYWALYYWAELAEYGTCVASSCENDNIYTCAALSGNGKRVRILIARYHEDDNYDTPRDVTVALPDGWKVKHLRITDSTGMDRKAEAVATLTLESNAIALMEIGL